MSTDTQRPEEDEQIVSSEATNEDGANEKLTTTPDGEEGESAEEVTDTPESTTTDEEHAETEAPELAREPEKGSGSTSRWAQVALVLVGLGLVAGLAATGVMNLDEPGAASTASTEVIARVNGEPITQAAFDQQMQQAEAFLSTLGGGDPAELDSVRGQLQESIVQDLINAELLHQEAVESGYAAEADAVDAEVAATRASVGGDEDFAVQLATLGLTEESFHELIEKQLTIDSYLAAETAIDEIEITDAEVEAFYAEATAEFDGDPPPLAEVRPNIEQQLSTEKSQAIVNALIDKLRAEAEVEVLL